MTKQPEYDKIKALSDLINMARKKIIANWFNFCSKASQQLELWKQNTGSNSKTREKRKKLTQFLLKIFKALHK